MTQPESKLSAKIKKALLERGAYVWKVHGNEFTPSGLPDIVGVYRGQFIGIESKMPGEKLSTIQEYRIHRLQKAGALIMAPCFTVVRAQEFLTDLDGMFGGAGRLEARIRCDRLYGKGWSASDHER